MHVDETAVDRVRERFGEPVLLHWSGEVSPEEMALIHRGGPSRRHDVTLFIFNGERLALIRKPSHPTGVWRTPGGGIKPGEEFVEGVLREALEETGAQIELERYLVRASCSFSYRGDEVHWQTHVLSASTHAEELIPLDTYEIEAARWGTAAELAGPIRDRLLATGRTLWRYRVSLHDAALAAHGGNSRFPP